jgi:hypothetical protein
LIFPLMSFSTRAPVPSLGGSITRFKPVIPIEVVGPAGQGQYNILVDTGADDVVFPFDIADDIGVDLSVAPVRQAQGVGSAAPSVLVYAPVILKLQDSQETCRWRAVVAFTRAPMRLALLGIAGGLQYFRTILDLDAREVQLLPQPLLPRTQDTVP